MLDPDICDSDRYRLRDVETADVELVREDPGVRWVGAVVYSQVIDDALSKGAWVALEEKMKE